MDEERLIESLRTGRVAVVGDVMLDHYVIGEVERISPEAPVPVLHVAHERQVLGGAANVAANIAAFGGKVSLVGVIGADASGREIVGKLDATSGVTNRLVTADAHPTIVKTRYTCGQQQIVRVDRERKTPLDDQTIEGLISTIQAAVNECSCVVLSDYGKGVLSDRVIAATIAAAKSAGATIIVDPKRHRFADYAGADYITPNRKEMSEATGLPCNENDEAELAAAKAISDSGAAILLTRSERGMSLFRADQAPVHMIAKAQEVFDVSGAGDTVVAAMSLALASGLSIENAMMLSNAAAGVVVGKLGTAICPPEELLAALRSDAETRERNVGQGVLSLHDAVAVRDIWRKQGLKVGFANGCFDLLHPGHVSLIKQAAAACDRLIVALNSDRSVRNLKGPTRPVQPQGARAEIISDLKGVDAVIIFDEPTPLEVIKALQPDLIVKGSDYREDQVVGGDLVKARGGRVLLVDLKIGHSTTSIVERLAAPPLGVEAIN